MNRLALLPLVASLLVMTCLTSGAEAGYQTTKPPGWGPRTSKAAAKLVTRHNFEARPMNTRDNHRVPGERMLKAWRRGSDMPYKRFVDGRFRGTTGEIIQWAAHKWGFDTNTMRAVAAVESWWDMNTLGDNGDSFGLYQVRRPYHCQEKCGIARHFTAFNADYYGAILRSYFDGKQTWLNTVSGNGKRYRRGDLKGSMGAWYSGRWWGPPDRPIEPYLEMIARYRSEKIWRHRDFLTFTGN